MLSEIDFHKVINLYVVPELSNGHLFDLISKNIRCIVFGYNFVNDEFATKGVWGFAKLKKKFKKLGLLTVYNKFCDQLQFSLSENKILNKNEMCNLYVIKVLLPR
jgi:hypothetical protein